MFYPPALHLVSKSKPLSVRKVHSSTFNRTVFAFNSSEFATENACRARDQSTGGRRESPQTRRLILRIYE